MPNATWKNVRMVNLGSVGFRVGLQEDGYGMQHIGLGFFSQKLERSSQYGQYQKKRDYGFIS